MEIIPAFYGIVIIANLSGPRIKKDLIHKFLKQLIKSTAYTQQNF